MSTTPRPSPFRQLAADALTAFATLAVITADEASTYAACLEALLDSLDPRNLRDLATAVAAVRADPDLLAPPGITSDEHHRRRNLLAALCCLGELRGQPGAKALVAEVPRLPRRTMLVRGRPLYDDERLLLRLVVTCLLRKGAVNHIAAAKYAFAEAGCTPGETTAVFIDDLDDPRQPSCVRAAGNRDRDQRQLDLDAWQAEVIGVVATTQARHGDLSKPIAYRGNHAPGSAPANMSCHRSIDILLDRAGLWHQEDVTASSITYSAADRIQRREGTTAAIHALGRGKTSSAHREQRAARDLRRYGTQPANHGAPAVKSFLESPFRPYGQKPA